MIDLHFSPTLDGKKVSIVLEECGHFRRLEDSQGDQGHAARRFTDDVRHIKRWFEELSERPAVQQGMEAGSEFANDYSQLSKEQILRIRKVLYNQRARPAPDEKGTNLG